VAKEFDIKKELPLWSNPFMGRTKALKNRYNKKRLLFS
jgi:hypothetical protein